MQDGVGTTDIINSMAVDDNGEIQEVEMKYTTKEN